MCVTNNSENIINPIETVFLQLKIYHPIFAENIRERLTWIVSLCSGGKQLLYSTVLFWPSHPSSEWLKIRKYTPGTKNILWLVIRVAKKNKSFGINWLSNYPIPVLYLRNPLKYICPYQSGSGHFSIGKVKGKYVKIFRLTISQPMIKN